MFLGPPQQVHHRRQVHMNHRIACKNVKPTVDTTISSYLLLGPRQQVHHGRQVQQAAAAAQRRRQPALSPRLQHVPWEQGEPLRRAGQIL